MPSKIISPTSRFNKTYLAKAWKDRASFTVEEWRGFSHFVYVSICGHLEYAIVHLMEFRLLYVGSVSRRDRIPPWDESINGKPCTFDSKPLSDSLEGLIKSAKAEVASAPLNKLIELFPKIFGTSFRNVVGVSLADDIDALGAIRNIVAHGRNLIVDFPDDELRAELMTANIDGNPIQKPLSRLKFGGVIRSTKVTGRNHHEIYEQVFSEKAVMYFYDAVRNSETKLVEALKFPPCPEAIGPEVLEPLLD